MFQRTAWVCVLVLLLTESTNAKPAVEFVFSGVCEKDPSYPFGCELFDVDEGGTVQALLFLDESVVQSDDITVLTFDDPRWDYLLAFRTQSSKSTYLPTTFSATLSSGASSFTALEIEASRNLPGGSSFSVREHSLVGYASWPAEATVTGEWKRRNFVPGDVNADGELAVDDLEWLCGDVAFGGHNAIIDLNGDDVVDGGDVQAFLRLVGLSSLELSRQVFLSCVRAFAT